jgi:hypothetical protein
MIELPEKDVKIDWSRQCEEAFLTLKKLFDVYCDASSTSIRGVLMQDGRAIA